MVRSRRQQVYRRTSPRAGARMPGVSKVDWAAFQASPANWLAAREYLALVRIVKDRDPRLIAWFETMLFRPRQELLAKLKTGDQGPAALLGWIHEVERLRPKKRIVLQAGSRLQKRFWAAYWDHYLTEALRPYWKRGKLAAGERFSGMYGALRTRCRRAAARLPQPNVRLLAGLGLGSVLGHGGVSPRARGGSGCYAEGRWCRNEDAARVSAVPEPCDRARTTQGHPRTAVPDGVPQANLSMCRVWASFLRSTALQTTR